MRKPAPNSTPFTPGTAYIIEAIELSSPSHRGPPVPTGNPSAQSSTLPPTESPRSAASPILSSMALRALLGPTGGYIVGFLLICPIYGLLCRNKAGLWAKALALFLGLLACYAFGTLWFVKVYGDTKGPITLLAALSKCVFPFILPDLAKLALALWAGKRLEKYRQ